jgi:hypothetical protein
VRAELIGGPRDGLAVELPELVVEIRAAVAELDLGTLSEASSVDEVAHRVVVYRLRYPVGEVATFVWTGEEE